MVVVVVVMVDAVAWSDGGGGLMLVLVVVVDSVAWSDSGGGGG